MLQGMSDYSKKQQTTEQLDDWLASNKGRIVLFLPFAGMIVLLPGPPYPPEIPAMFSVGRAMMRSA